MDYYSQAAASNAMDSMIAAVVANVESSNTQNVAVEATNAEPQFKTVKAQINGGVQEIILARHKYSMEELKTSQQKKLELIDKDKMLDVIFHVTTADIFYKADIQLKDYAGKEIPAGTPNVYVPIETPDTFYRFVIDDVLNTVVVHSLRDVQEFAEITGTTTFFSRGLTAKEQTGIAALATNDEVCNAIYNLSVEANMPASTAQRYLDTRLKGTTTVLMTTGYKPKDHSELGRTYAEARELHLKVSLAFGVTAAKKRYAVSAMNYLQKVAGIKLETILRALETIPANEVAKTKLVRCEDKETCIVTTMIEWIRELDRRNQKNLAA